MHIHASLAPSSSLGPFGASSRRRFRERTGLLLASEGLFPRPQRVLAHPLSLSRELPGSELCGASHGRTQAGKRLSLAYLQGRGSPCPFRTTGVCQECLSAFLKEC